MMAAQQLYEGINIGKGGAVGLITYMRTDSTRISSIAKHEASQFLHEKYGAEYSADVCISNTCRNEAVPY